MKKITNGKLRRLSAIFTIMFLCGLTGSCIREDHNKKKVDRESLVLSVALPSSALTRGLTDMEDNKVVSMHVILIDSNTGKFVDVIEGDELNDGLTVTEKTFSVELPYGKFDLLVLANSAAAIAGASLDDTMNRDEVAEAVTMFLDAWGYTSASATPFPMWGEMTNVTVNKDTDLSGETVYMIRMAVRIDVMLSPYYIETHRDEKIVSVYLYNRYTDGQVIPNSGTYIPITSSDPSLLAISGPSIPTGYGKTYGPLFYEVNQAEEVRATIYTFEAEAGSFDDLLNNTCLVVGLGTEPDPGSVVTRSLSSPPTRSGENGAIVYHRLDFYNFTTNQYLPLLRNHEYDVTINDIYGKGFPTPLLAFRSEPMPNGNYSVTAWEPVYIESDLNTSTYILTVDPTYWHVTAGGAQTVESNVTTTHPSGWTCDVSDFNTHILDAGVSDWLSAEPSSSGDKVVITMTASGMRTGYVFITSGNMSNVITVIQGTQN